MESDMFAIIIETLVDNLYNIAEVISVIEVICGTREIVRTRKE